MRFGRLFCRNRLPNALVWAEAAWRVWHGRHARIVWIDCDHVIRIYRTGLGFGRIRMGNWFRDLYSWPSKKAVIQWFLAAAERGADLPLFPDTVVLHCLIKAIEAGGISVPRKRKEAVASAILKRKLDTATRGMN